jgi:FRG domain
VTPTAPPMLEPKDVFRGVFEQIFFPYLAVDMKKLCDALRAGPRATTAVAVPLGELDPAKRAVLASSFGGLLTQVEIPSAFLEVLVASEVVDQLGLGEDLRTMAAEPAFFAVVEDDDRLVWEEATLWPLAYSTLVEQLVAIIELRADVSGRSARALPGIELLEEYARHMPTHLHYAVASLAAWLGGAANMQYFAYFATQPQIKQPEINRAYAEAIAYSADDAAELDASGLLTLPATLAVPLLTAQGGGPVFGSISIDEWNTANKPTADFFAAGEEPPHPGFVLDKYYRAPFRARPLETCGLYGAQDVLRDHYESFYDEVEPVALIRCKHFSAPVIEVSSLDEIRRYTSGIPLHEGQALFFRGQTRFYRLPRTDRVRRLLFADSCDVEPSLVTSAARRHDYDYDGLHFALKHFLECKLLTRDDVAGEELRAWQSKSASPLCELDHAVMALAQHYGLPSHGLDVTLRDEVALWFATNLLERDADERYAYRTLSIADWPDDPEEWPVVFAHQSVTHTMRTSLHDCHELDEFGFGAHRPALQRAKFFLGGHSDHQNRLAETVVCAFRLRPGSYPTDESFDTLFPSPAADPAYRVMLEFSQVPAFEALGAAAVLRFHAS